MEKSSRKPNDFHLSENFSEKYLKRTDQETREFYRDNPQSEALITDTENVLYRLVDSIWFKIELPEVAALLLNRALEFAQAAGIKKQDILAELEDYQPNTRSSLAVEMEELAEEYRFICKGPASES